MVAALPNRTAQALPTTLTIEAVTITVPNAVVHWPSHPPKPHQSPSSLTLITLIIGVRAVVVGVGRATILVAVAVISTEGCVIGVVAVVVGVRGLGL